MDPSEGAVNEPSKQRRTSKSAKALSTETVSKPSKSKPRHASKSTKASSSVTASKPLKSKPRQASQSTKPSSSATASSLQLLSLTDDALLHVLSYLSAEELQQCRKVCRRLRNACLHPHLWRSIRLEYYEDAFDTKKAVVLRALRTAPCLRGIYLPFLDLDIFASILSSSCVIEGLRMNIQEPTAVARAIAILHRLSSLGGLRDLHISSYGMSLPHITPLLYAILYNVSNLTKLNLLIDPLPDDLFCPVGIKPSLTSLNVWQSGGSLELLKTLLKGHAATLTSVKVIGVENIPVSLLKTIPNFKSLTCRAIDALSELQSAQTLEHICLSSTLKIGMFPPGALEFLRRAPQLRHVSIMFPRKDSAAPLLALSESPSAGRVESLTLGGYWPHGCMEQVAAALHRFPSLHTLTVRTVASTSLLRAVNPSATPRLTTLNFYKPDGVCLHGWLHGPVQALLISNPHLHLHVEKRGDGAKCTCSWCEWGCHPELKKSTSAVFSSHRRKAGCPADCFLVDLSPKGLSCDQ